MNTYDLVRISLVHTEYIVNGWWRKKPHSIESPRVAWTHGSFKHRQKKGGLLAWPANTTWYRVAGRTGYPNYPMYAVPKITWWTYQRAKNYDWGHFGRATTAWHYAVIWMDAYLGKMDYNSYHDHGGEDSGLLKTVTTHKFNWYPR